MWEMNVWFLKIQIGVQGGPSLRINIAYVNRKKTVYSMGQVFLQHESMGKYYLTFVCPNGSFPCPGQWTTFNFCGFFFTINHYHFFYQILYGGITVSKFEKQILFKSLKDKKKNKKLRFTKSTDFTSISNSQTVTEHIMSHCLSFSSTYEIKIIWIGI